MRRSLADLAGAAVLAVLAVAGARARDQRFMLHHPWSPRSPAQTDTLVP